MDQALKERLNPSSVAEEKTVSKEIAEYRLRSSGLLDIPFDQRTLKDDIAITHRKSVIDNGCEAEPDIQYELGLLYKNALNSRNKHNYYDPVSKQYLTYEQFQKLFGYKKAEEAHGYYKDGEKYPAEFIVELRSIGGKTSSGKKELPEAKTETISRTIQAEPDQKYQFVPTRFELLDNEDFRKTLVKAYPLYLFLRRFISRAYQSGDGLDLYNRYYVKGKLASVVSIRQLAKSFSISRSTANIYIETIIKSGAVKIEEVSANDAWDSQHHHIYVLGEIRVIDGKEKEIFYIDEVYGGGK